MKDTNIVSSATTLLTPCTHPRDDSSSTMYQASTRLEILSAPRGARRHLTAHLRCLPRRMATSLGPRDRYWYVSERQVFSSDVRAHLVHFQEHPSASCARRRPSAQCVFAFEIPDRGVGNTTLSACGVMRALCCSIDERCFCAYSRPRNVPVNTRRALAPFVPSRSRVSLRTAPPPPSSYSLTAWRHSSCPLSTGAALEKMQLRSDV